MSQLEFDNHMLNNETRKTEADYTICQKMTVSETPPKETSVNEMSVNGTSFNDTALNVSIVEYLFDQGKCGNICKKGKILYLRYVFEMIRRLLFLFVILNNFLLLFLYTTEPKCYCTYPLEEQRNTTAKGTNKIMCEKSRGIQPGGRCNEDEYCAGPTTLKDAVCGKKLLCTKKGIHEFIVLCGTFSLANKVVSGH